LKLLQEKYPHLHHSFIPDSARYISHKKLGITMGIKASHYDWLVFTEPNCRPESNQWLRKMARNFTSNTDIVLGYSNYEKTKGWFNRKITFDTMLNSMRQLGRAIGGHPYTGCGRNLAYRKDFFFETGGFTHLMTSRAGDDDLFVNHVATKANTAVILSRDSYTWSVAKKTMKEWWQQKRRHVSVSPSYRESTKFRLALEPLTRGLFYVLVLAMLILYFPQIQICQKGGGRSPGHNSAVIIPNNRELFIWCIG
jgi:cellulose synthase/poly-beta-1,6-N-acetylglucosamine synthase-like glycosyltransferase